MAQARMAVTDDAAGSRKASAELPDTCDKGRALDGLVRFVAGEALRGELAGIVWARMQRVFAEGWTPASQTPAYHW